MSTTILLIRKSRRDNLIIAQRFIAGKPVHLCILVPQGRLKMAGWYALCVTYAKLPLDILAEWGYKPSM